VVAERLANRLHIKLQLTRIKTAFLKHIEVNRNWAGKMVFCEVLNLLNCVLQIYLTHLFLGRQFLMLGFDFIEDNFLGIMDTLDIIFPKVTKCHFHKYGASGTIQRHDALCVMALNVINEKIFTVMWFWYGVLLTVSILSLMWRLLTLYLHSRSNAFNGFVFSMVCPGKMNPWDMLVVTNNFYFSDWLFLFYLAKNMEAYLFRQMLLEHIIPEIQSETSSVIVSHDGSEMEADKLKGNDDDDDGEEEEAESADDHSLNSTDMAIVVPSSSLAAVNEKRVKFA